MALLHAGILTSGIYSYQWNGLDLSGKSVASGFHG